MEVYNGLFHNKLTNYTFMLLIYVINEIIFIYFHKQQRFDVLLVEMKASTSLLHAEIISTISIISSMLFDTYNCLL